MTSTLFIGTGETAFIVPVDVTDRHEARGVQEWLDRTQKYAAHFAALMHAEQVRHRLLTDVGVRLSISLTRLVRPRQHRLTPDRLIDTLIPIRDGVAAALGLGNASRMEWRFAQVRGDNRRCGVVVEILENDISSGHPILEAE